MTGPPVSPAARSALLSLPREVRNFIYKEYIWTCHEAAIATAGAASSSSLTTAGSDFDSDDEDSFSSTATAASSSYNDEDRPNAEHHTPPLLRNLTATRTRASALSPLLLTNHQLHVEFLDELFRLAHERCTPGFSSSSTSFDDDDEDEELAPPPYFSPLTAFPYPLHLAIRLRSFDLEVRTEDTGGGRRVRWTDFHDNVEASAERVLEFLPALEALCVSLSLGPGIRFVRRAAGERDVCETERLLGFVPERLVGGGGGDDAAMAEAEAETGAGAMVSRGTQTGGGGSKRKRAGAKGVEVVAGAYSPAAAAAFAPRLKSFKKMIVVRFAFATEFPLVMNSVTEHFDAENGRMVSHFAARCGGFVNEFGTMELREMREFVEVVEGEGAWQSQFEHVPKPALVSRLYEVWESHGKISKRRYKKMKARRDEQRELQRTNEITMVMDDEVMAD